MKKVIVVCPVLICVLIYVMLYTKKPMRRRTWTVDQLKKLAAQSTSTRQVIKGLKLKPAGGNYAQINKYIKIYNIDTGHFAGKAWNKGRTGMGKPRLQLKEILQKDTYYQSYKLKKRLFAAKIKTPCCEQCGWAEKSTDGRTPLELDHVNGDRHDNRLSNLRILCPNCHSLQPTHRGRNRKK